MGDGPDDRIKELSDILVKGRIAFLDQAIITVEITAFQTLDTAFQILDNVAKISTRLEKVSNQISEVGG